MGQGPVQRSPLSTERLRRPVASKRILQQNLPTLDYAYFLLALASAKQRPRTSMGGLQADPIFEFSGACSGSLSFT
jgi:hypothetical protein